MAGGLEVGRHKFARAHRRDGERDERRRDVVVEERTRHRVLTADGGGAELELGVQRAEERGKGLAPARGLIAKLLEEFL